MHVELEPLTHPVRFSGRSGAPRNTGAPNVLNVRSFSGGMLNELCIKQNDGK